MIGSIQNIKFEAFGSLQRGFYGIPYIGYFPFILTPWTSCHLNNSRF